MSFSVLDSELTGPLFSTGAMREVFADRQRLAAMLRVEAALARAQAQFGLVPSGLAEVIAAIDPESLDIPALGRATANAGVPVIPFVKAVQARLPGDLEAHFHKGATTQDILDTALALQMGQAFALLADDVQKTIEGLVRLAQKHRTTPCVGRTYGQHAAPLSFGYKIAVWLNGIAEIAAELPRIRERALVVSLGGPVGTLSGLGEAAIPTLEAVAAELHLGVPTIAWHSQRSRVVEAGLWLAMLLGALAKMALDIAHLASTEVGEVAEPHVAGRGGSSAMPHKRNPVSATVILAAHAAAGPFGGQLLAAMAATHERPFGTWHAEWNALPQLFGFAAGALAEARRLAEGLEVDTARMQTNLDATHGLLFADAVASHLARSLGRQAAHDLVERAADRVRHAGQSLREVLWENGELSREAQQAIDAAFDLGPPLAAAARFVDRALAQAAAVCRSLTPRAESDQPVS
jgi:3-carboxy-cis,cis-muconate cycloisomerase